MAKSKSITDAKKLKENSDSLRKFADAKILKSEIEQKELSFEESKHIMHELQVHQIELEIQNEQLRQSQLALDETREEYYNLYNFAPVGYIALDEKGKIIKANLAATNLLSIPNYESTECFFTKYILKEDQDRFYLNRNRLIETKKKQQFELKISKGDGIYFEALVDMMLSVKMNGDEYILITISDISKLKINEEKLKESEKFLKETQIIGNLGTYTMDIVSDKWTSSEILDTIFGIDSDFDKSSKGWASIIHPDWQKTMKDYFIQEVVGKGIKFDKEYKIIKPNEKKERWVHGIGELKFNDMNQPITMIGTIQDITESKQTGEAIRLKNEELIKLNAEKDKFFSIIAHDLRSPFTGFLGWTDLLKTDLHHLTNKELQDIANSLNRSANRLFGLLTNLLEWSMMQRGLTAFSPVKLSLKKIVKEIVKIFKDTINTKKIKLVEEISDDVLIIADESMLKAIIRNLVSNSIKFTKKGGRVTISANMFEENVLITVQDNGIGMSHELINDLFKLDKQTNRNGTENEPSSGLGLFLCKEYIEKHNGKMWIVSEEEKGSEFIISLPIVKTVETV